MNDDYEFSVQFTKNNRGLGFTISSYVGDLNSGKFHLYPIKNKNTVPHLCNHFSVSFQILYISYIVLSSVYSAGVMVKSIVKGSTADQDGRIHVGDIILSVSFSFSLSFNLH